MSDTFKYLESAGEDNEAQKFLKKRMESYTPEQRAMLEASGGPSKVGSSNGVIPEGDAYDAQNPTKNQDTKKSTTTTSTSTGSDAYKDFDVNDKYKSGQWGSGKLSQQDLADKYGLDTSAEANKGDTAVWGTNRTGERVFLGNIDNSQRSNDDIIKAHSAQADSGEVDHGSMPESVSSDGDVIGAMLNMWDGGGGPDKETAPEPEKERTPIEHSPEVKQATERVRAYEDNIMSGKTSSDIFGDTYGNTGLDLDSKTDASSTVDNNQPDAMQRINDKYSINLNKGIAGIGTSSYEEPKSNEAAASFLDSKKSDYKSAYNFKPSTNSAYGS